jgi:hypothetical protein
MGRNIGIKVTYYPDYRESHWSKERDRLADRVVDEFGPDMLDQFPCGIIPDVKVNHITGMDPEGFPIICSKFEFDVRMISRGRQLAEVQGADDFDVYEKIARFIITHFPVDTGRIVMEPYQSG